MPRKVIISGLALLGLSLLGCKDYESVGADGYKTPQDFYSSLNVGPALTCDQGKSLRPRTGSRVSWEIMRNSTVSGEELPFLGSNAVGGQLNIPGGNLANATAILTFDISSTYSDNALRDERIHEYIFGKRKGQILRFTLSGFKEQEAVLADQASLDVTALGKLEIAGQVAEIEIPLLIKSRAGIVTVSPSKLFRMNMRALSPEVNGINIGEAISQILAYVTNISVQDEVVIDFNVEFEEHCEKR